MAGGKDARTGMQTVKGENDKTGKRTTKGGCRQSVRESFLEQGRGNRFWRRKMERGFEAVRYENGARN